MEGWEICILLAIVEEVVIPHSWMDSMHTTYLISWISVKYGYVILYPIRSLLVHYGWPCGPSKRHSPILEVIDWICVPLDYFFLGIVEWSHSTYYKYHKLFLHNRLFKLNTFSLKLYNIYSNCWANTSFSKVKRPPK